MTDSNKEVKQQDKNSSDTKSTDNNNSSTSNNAESAPPTEPEHPLQNRWKLWYSPPAKYPQAGEEWKSNNQLVYEVATVESYWRLYNVLKPPTQIQNKTDYYLFKSSSEPEWEHESNKGGGRWGFSLNRKDINLANKVDDYWLNLLLAIIGEQFEDSDEINGIVVQKKPGEYRFGIWTRACPDEEKIKRIGQQFKQFINYTNKVVFNLHSEGKVEKFTA
jgi:translation initiation factor 4E